MTVEPQLSKKQKRTDSVKNIGCVVQLLCGQQVRAQWNNRYLINSSFEMVEYTSETDDKLADVAKDMPKNAKYTCRDIKNGLIETHGKHKSQKGQEKVYEC